MKNIFKVGIFIILISTMLTSCNDSENNNAPSDNESNNEVGQIVDDVLVIESEVDMLYNIADPEQLNNVSTDIALVYVESVDGASAFNPLTKEAVYPYTFGTMTVINAYKGKLVSDQTIDFIRMGATLPYTEYYESLEEVQKEKVNSLSKVKPTTVEIKFEDDIKIEKGKYYLAYLEANSTFSNNAMIYSITGLQGGLREIKGEQAHKITSMSSNLLVLNNFTNQWEELSEIPF